MLGPSGHFAPIGTRVVEKPPNSPMGETTSLCAVCLSLDFLVPLRSLVSLTVAIPSSRLEQPIPCCLGRNAKLERVDLTFRAVEKAKTIRKIKGQRRFLDFLASFLTILALSLQLVRTGPEAEPYNC